ncbi:chemotaxis protein CheX [Sulfurimonas aquatica]|uniref:Chemotaxis protein CheX n=1 Tax=Sulfurimonas aquatica TaxID=2672570 RepID=A0A975B0F7_9BACT|nr:chemotaxis protein CheX [Sulfurimonas aquatica]QSZ41860.1 chemotaxis protein CheX [Sulfurimonas aquatica]
MFKTIEDASINFCIHQLRENHLLKDGISDKRTLIAYIDINIEDDTKHRVYIASDESFMQKVSKIFLEEDESDEETLIDMSLETANLIIGSAKVLAEDSDTLSYAISTPHFEKIGVFDFAYDHAKTIVVEDSELTIAIKELNV